VDNRSRSCSEVLRRAHRRASGHSREWLWRRPLISPIEDVFPLAREREGWMANWKREAAVRDRRHIVSGAYQVPPLYHETGSSRVVRKS